MSPLERRAQVQARILELLPATARTLERVVGISSPCMHRHLTRLHDHGLIHIGGWEAPDRPGTIGRIWHAGRGRDVDPPEPSAKAKSSRAARKAPKAARKPTKPTTGRDWVLKQLSSQPIPITDIRQGARTQQAFSNLINRLAADGAISIRKGHDASGHVVRLVRKGNPESDEELAAQDVARDRMSSLSQRRHRHAQDRTEMLAMIWATAGMRRAA